MGANHSKRPHVDSFLSHYSTRSNAGSTSNRSSTTTDDSVSLNSTNSAQVDTYLLEEEAPCPSLDEVNAMFKEFAVCVKKKRSKTWQEY